MKSDVAVSPTAKDSPGAEKVPTREPARPAGSNSSDESIGMVQERSDFVARLPPVQPFPLASKSPPRSDEARAREPTHDLDVGRNSSDNARDRPSIGRRIFRSVGSFFITALIAVLAGILVSSAWQSYGDDAKAMVTTWASSAWQSRGDEAKRMVKEAWTSSLGWLMKNSPLGLDIAAKQKNPGPAGQLSTRDTAQAKSVAQKPAPAATLVPFDSMQQLKTIAHDLTVVRQRLEQLTDAQQQMAQKLASLQALDIRQKKSPPLQPPPPPPAAPVPLRKNALTTAARPSILADWWIKHARDGHIYVQGHGEVYRVVPGTPLPGLGPVEQIKRQNGRWVVMTPKGIIASTAAPESDDDDIFDGD